MKDTKMEGKIMNEISMEVLFGKCFAEAIERECERRKMTPTMFFANFIHWWADDEFFDYMMGLCFKYRINADDDAWDRTDEDRKILRDFFRAGMPKKDWRF